MYDVWHWSLDGTVGANFVTIAAPTGREAIKTLRESFVKRHGSIEMKAIAYPSNTSVSESFRNEE
jgi:hypothetical protein